MMHANAALTARTKEPDKITSSEVKLPYSYLYKVSGWLSPKVKRWLGGNADAVPVLDGIQEQVIDVTSSGIISLSGSDFLERLYTFRDGVNVRAFLVRYPFLISLLLEANPHLRRHFPEQRIFLEVISDPETIDSSQLVALIVETPSPDEAFDKLERFDKEWWISAVGRAKGKLCINVEFV